MTPRRAPLLFALLAALAVLVVRGGSAGAAAPPRDPQALLEDGRGAYLRHDYPAVEAAVRPLLYPTVELPSKESVLEAHRLLALSYFFQKRYPEARQEVVSLLALDPNYELDRYAEPPVAVSFFQKVKEDQYTRLEEIRKQQLAEEAERRKREEQQRAEAARKQRTLVEKTVTRRSRLVALVPFGLGQWQNGHKKKAVFFFTSELTLGLLSLASWAAVEGTFPDRTFRAEQATTARALLGLQLASGAAFWVLAVAGIIEAQVRLVPETTTTREVPRPARAMVLPLPIVGADASGGVVAGVGVGGRF